MEMLCSHCARLSFVQRNVATRRVHQGLRSFSAVQHRANTEGKPRAPQSDLSKAETLKDGNRPVTAPRRPIIRRYAAPEADRANGGQLSGNTNTRSSTAPGTSTRQVLQRAPPREGAPILRRSPSSGGPVLRRTGGSSTAQSGFRSRQPGTNDGKGALRTRGKPGQGAGSGGKGPGAKKFDRRRRLTPQQEENHGEREEVERLVTEQIEKNIDPPANPTTFLPYDPQKISLDSLRADWPNTPLSTAGITESVVQKIEWLSRRLPHGYQSPEQIAEHYLKGNLTRFESDAERETILKLATELSAKTKSDDEAGLLHKHEPHRFPNIDDSAFTSLAAKSTERSFLVETGVKGNYENTARSELPLLQNAAQVLNSNETYGPIQARRFLKRIEALMPQARVADGKAKNKAKRA